MYTLQILYGSKNKLEALKKNILAQTNTKTIMIVL